MRSGALYDTEHTESIAPMNSKRPPSKIRASVPARPRAAKTLLASLLPDARRNDLLAALPDSEWARWLPQLEPVALPLGKVL